LRTSIKEATTKLLFMRSLSALTAVRVLRRHRCLPKMSSSSNAALEIDPAYPGTAVARMRAAQARARTLTTEELSNAWSEVRKKLLWAAGLKDLTNVRPGAGYTGHAFNDDIHCDATCMLDGVSHNLNDGEQTVSGIVRNNRLGPGITTASDPTLGPGGSWSTCTNGCHLDPPRDVAHVQFQSRIAFKLVWCPPEFESFVLVDDAGALLAQGSPSSGLPHLSYRQRNFGITKGSKYAVEAEKAGKGSNGNNPNGKI